MVVLHHSRRPGRVEFQPDGYRGERASADGRSMYVSLIQKFLAKLRRRRAAPPVIETQWGPVTEGARRQAALNMRDDPKLCARVQALVINECGGDVKTGLAEFRRRYPEVYE